MKFDESAMSSATVDGVIDLSALRLVWRGTANGLAARLRRANRSGRLQRAVRGIYLAEGAVPHALVLATRIRPCCYATAQWALRHHGLIPEAVFALTCATGGRPGTCQTPAGTILFRHLRPDWLFGCEWTTLGGTTVVGIATPEKALLDLAHWTSGDWGAGEMQALRLEDPRGLVRPRRLLGLAKRWGKPKILRAAVAILRYLGKGEGQVRLSRCEFSATSPDRTKQRVR